MGLTFFIQLLPFFSFFVILLSRVEVMPDLSYLVGPDLGNETVGKSRNYDPPAYLDSSIRETIRQFQEYQERQKSQRESLFDIFSNRKSGLDSCENFSYVIKRAQEMVMQPPPSEIQRRTIIDKLSEQNELLSKQHAQDREQIELQKQEIDLLKKTLESLGILPSIGDNIEKIATQTEKEQKTPEYVTALIEAGLLDKDWKATKGLPKIVRFLHTDWKMDNLEAGILLQFKQRTGEPFSLRTVQEEIKRVKNSQ